MKSVLKYDFITMLSLYFKPSQGTELTNMLKALSFFFFFFSCCRGPDAAQRAHDVRAFGVVSGKGREVGWRGGEEQAVSVKCWLMGLRAADQTPWLGP